MHNYVANHSCESGGNLIMAVWIRGSESWMYGTCWLRECSVRRQVVQQCVDMLHGVFSASGSKIEKGFRGPCIHFPSGNRHFPCFTRGPYPQLRKPDLSLSCALSLTHSLFKHTPSHLPSVLSTAKAGSGFKTWDLFNQVASLTVTTAYGSMVLCWAANLLTEFPQ